MQGRHTLGWEDLAPVPAGVRQRAGWDLRPRPRRSAESRSPGSRAGHHCSGRNHRGNKGTRCWLDARRHPGAAADKTWAAMSGTWAAAAPASVSDRGAACAAPSGQRRHRALVSLTCRDIAHQRPGRTALRAFCAGTGPDLYCGFGPGPRVAAAREPERDRDVPAAAPDQPGPEQQQPTSHLAQRLQGWRTAAQPTLHPRRLTPSSAAWRHSRLRGWPRNRSCIRAG